MPRLQQTHVHCQWRVLFRGFCDVKSRAELCYCFSSFRVSVCFTPPSLIKGNVIAGCFCLQSLPKRECEVSLIGSRRKSQLMQCIAVWCSVLQPVCSKNPTTKPLGCGSYFSGPLTGLHKSRRYRRDEWMFVRWHLLHISQLAPRILTWWQFFGGVGVGNFCTFSIVKELRPSTWQEIACVIHYIRVFLTRSPVIDFRKGAIRKDW